MAKRRKPGSGSIHLRKDGRWEGRIVIGYDENGFPKTKNILARTKRECQEKLKALLESLKKTQPAQSAADMLFGDWLDFWYQTYSKPTIRPKTQGDYENRIYGHIIPRIGHIPLKKLSQADLQQFYADLKQSGRLIRTDQYGEGLSDRSVRGCHNTCRHALDKAVEEGLIRTNPAVLCKLPQSQAREMKVLEPEEIQRLLIQAKENDCYELLLLDLSTGLRRGEICALQWDDLDSRTGELHIHRQVQRINGKLEVSEPKTKAALRTIVLPPAVLRVLQDYRKTVHSAWMFPSPKNEDNPRDPTAVRKKLSIVLKRAECSQIRFHDLRHTFATLLLENGIDVKTLSTIIGHVSSGTTLNVYAHATDGMRRTAADKIDRAVTKTEVSDKDTSTPAKPTRTTFTAQKGKCRKQGTGCVRQIGEQLWEGRYSPRVNGVRRTKNVYARTEAECEEKLAELIATMKAEIAAERKA